jgi:hypothetical protein
LLGEIMVNGISIQTAQSIPQSQRRRTTTAQASDTIILSYNRSQSDSFERETNPKFQRDCTYYYIPKKYNNHLSHTENTTEGNNSKDTLIYTEAHKAGQKLVDDIDLDFIGDKKLAEDIKNYRCSYSCLALG